jgi:hypothetical protein
MCDSETPCVENGFMAVSERPGIGIELNDKIAKTLLWNNDTYFD